MPLIYAVIVTYNPETIEGVLQLLAAVAAQVAHIVVVDNASHNAKELEALCQKPNITWIPNHENKGLAAAQNQGLRHALEQEAEWLLLLDDDSVPEAYMVSRLLQSLENIPEPERIAIIAPAIHDTHSSQPPRYVCTAPWGFRRVMFNKQEHLFPLAVIASGSLIKASVLQQLGLMEESFFIDYIDTEFSLRCIAAGYQIIAVRDAVLHHQLGAKREHHLAGKTLVTSNHSAARRYTIYRNRVLVWKRYALCVPRYIAYDMLAVFYDLFRIMCFEQQKYAKLKSALKGFWHGLRR